MNDYQGYQKKTNSLNSVINEISEAIDMVKYPLIKRKFGGYK